MIGKRLRFEILERDRYRCRYCGRSGKASQLHVDHVKPKARGGTDHRSNLVTACIDCNLGKGVLVIRSRHPVAIPSQDWPNDIEDPVYFANDQWVVTTFGIECLRTPYSLNANALIQRSEGGLVYEWPCHLARKSWVDPVAFITAFFRAIDIHDLWIEPACLERTIEEMGAIAALTQEGVSVSKLRHAIEDATHGKFVGDDE